MTMVLRRPLFRNDSFSRTFKRDSRPTLKIACGRYATSLDSGRAYYDNIEASSTSSTSSRPTGLVSLSTPSPSATANGNRVDIEFEKFRRLSEEWIRNREIEESENSVDNLGSRSPSPQRLIHRRSNSQPPQNRYQRDANGQSQQNRYQRDANSQPPQNKYQRDARSPSPERSPDRSFRSPSVQRSESPFRNIRSTSPSPLVFSPVTKTFVRSNSTDSDNSNAFSSNYRKPAPRESSLPPPSVYRRSFSYEGEKKYYSLPSRSPSPQRYTPVSSIFKRSNSYENDEKIRSNFRSRSTSPQRLTPASSYYRRQNNDGRENGFYSPSYNPRSRIQQNNSSFLNSLNQNNNKSNQSPPETKLFNRTNFNNLKSFYSDTTRDKYHSLPRNLFSNKPPSNGNNDLTKRTEADTNYSNNRLNNLFNFPPLAPSKLLISPNRPSDKQFLPNTLPDLSSYRMAAPRRFSEEPSPFRKPLATLHEDEVVARRRYSDGIRKRSYDIDILNDYDAYQRKLSEAGIRKLSDASVVLTEDTDSFIIGDRVWVGGTKPGMITYIGETQFAPGEWAGVTLDEPVGKNNGSVGGVRYFQCEPKKGVFSRLTRLSRIPLSDIDLEILAARSSVRASESPRSTPGKDISGIGRKITPTQQPSDMYRKTSQSNEPVRKITPGSPGTKSPLYGKSGSPSPSGSVKKGPPAYTGITDLKLGERVVIESTSGTKYGVLRYLGRAEFADGIWAGVELDDPSGKNDGSVAGKKYFMCRNKYGLFAPIARVRSFALRSNSRPSLPSLRRSGSRESLGASSAASSTVSSSLRGTRRPSRTSTSGTSPTTKALQETLAEKTLHVDQLMKERDVERGEMARIASQLDEATRIAQDFKMQLDQLQIESEERLHDFGEKVQFLEQEKKDCLAKLEDKQKEIDDLNFRIEEETFAKADFESQSITHTERLKQLEKELGEERKKLKDRGEKEAQKDDEMEEIEINLRGSIEEFQAKVMDLEQEKENLEKKLEEIIEKSKTLETVNSSLSNSVNEKEQKICLLEASQTSEEEREKEKMELVNKYEEEIKGIELELERKAKDYEDVSQQAEEFLADLETNKAQMIQKDKELNELKEKVKSGRDSEGKLSEDLNELTNQIKSLEANLSEQKEKVSVLEGENSRLKTDVEKTSETSNKIFVDIEALHKSLGEKDAEKKTLLEKLANVEEELSSHKKNLENEVESLKKRDKELEETRTDLKLLKENFKEMESINKASILEISDFSRKVTEYQLQIKEHEDAKKKLEGQLEVVMSSSTTSSDQLRNLNLELREAEAKADAASKGERETKAELERAKECSKEEVESLKKSKEEMEENLMKDINNLKEGKEELEKKIINVEEAKGMLTKQMNEEKEELLRKLEEEEKRHKVDLMSKDEDKSKLEEELKTLLEEQTKNYKNLVEQFENNKKVFGEERETHEKDLFEMTAKVALLEEKYKELDDDKSRTQSECDEKKALLKQSEGKIEMLAGQMESLQTQLLKGKQNIEKEMAIAEEDKKEVLLLKSALDEVKTQLGSLEDVLNATVSEKEVALEENNNLVKQLEKLKSMEEEKKSLLENQNRLEEEIKILHVEKEKNVELTEEKMRLEVEIKRISALESDKLQVEKENQRLEEELQGLKKLGAEFDNLKLTSQALEAKVQKLKELEKEVDRLSSDLSNSGRENESLRAKCEEMATVIEKNSQLQESNTLQEAKIKAIEEQKQKLTKDLEKTKENVAHMKKLEEKYKKLQDVCSHHEKELELGKARLSSSNQELEDAVEELKKSYNTRITNLESEKGNLVEEVVSLQDKYSEFKKESEVEIKRLKEREESKGSIDRESAELRLKVLGLESEKRKLEGEVKNLKDDLALSSAGSGEKNEFVAQMKEERDLFEGQVNFLNSVIVDMQKKKNELETRIEVLQSGNLQDDQKASLNGLTERKAVAPRLFCDICDCFDLHDTEECPQQISGDSPTPTQYHADRDATRPYCDSCEVFGHEDGECPLDETF